MRPSGSYFEQCLNMHCSFHHSSGLLLWGGSFSDLSLHCTWPPATGLSKILFIVTSQHFGTHTHTQHKGLSFYSNQGPLGEMRCQSNIHLYTFCWINYFPSISVSVFLSLLSPRFFRRSLFTHI